MNFEIEVVDMYPFMSAEDKKNKLPASKYKRFSCHIYVAIYDIDIRGIVAKKNTEDWFICMPSNRNYDLEEKKLTIFPILEFTNPKKKEAFILELKKKVIDYYPGFLAKHEIDNFKKQSKSTVKKKLETLTKERNNE